MQTIKLRQTTENNGGPCMSKNESESVIFSRSLCITWSLGRASKTGEHLCVYKAYQFIIFFKMTDCFAR